LGVVVLPGAREGQGARTGHGEQGLEGGGGGGGRVVVVVVVALSFFAACFSPPLVAYQAADEASVDVARALVRARAGGEGVL
jgi:hypothetical protein